MPRGIRKVKHEWLATRAMDKPSIVLRIDDYNTLPLSRGQFTPNYRNDDSMKAIWPNQELAAHAAEWAAKKFGHQYAVFTMVAIVESAEPPLKVTAV
jgi:hypothetical protein